MMFDRTLPWKSGRMVVTLFVVATGVVALHSTPAIAGMAGHSLCCDVNPPGGTSCTGRQNVNCASTGDAGCTEYVVNEDGFLIKESHTCCTWTVSSCGGAG